MLLFIFTLIFIFQIKHFIADYPLQNAYMLGKFKPDWGFFFPLVAHCGVHALFTLTIISFTDVPFSYAVKLALLDFVVHFIMDRLKASPKYLGRFKTLTKDEFPTATNKQLLHNKLFWWSLGLDQMVHHLTHYIIIILIALKLGY